MLHMPTWCLHAYMPTWCLHAYMVPTCLHGAYMVTWLHAYMVPEGRLIGLPTEFGFALVEAHFGMWRSATSASNLRPQCGQAVRRSSGSSKGGGGASPLFIAWPAFIACCTGEV